MDLDLQQQILNMKLMVGNFKTACHYAAIKDDGKVDPEEQRILKKIDAASDRFLKELQKIKL